MNAITEVGSEIVFADKFKAAVALVDSFKTIVVRTAGEHAAAESLLDQARQFRKDLKKGYDENVVILAAKRIQEAKVKLDNDLEQGIKNVKNGPMLAFERAEEAKRVAEENRLAKIRQDAIDKENARLAKIAADKKAEDDKEAARLAKIAAATKDKAKKEEAERAAADAKERADESAREQQRLKEEAANTPAPVVILEKTAPTAANRRTVKRWRIKSKEGIVYNSTDLKPSMRLPATDFPGLDPKYFVLNPMAVSGITDSLGKNHGIPGVEYWEEPA